MESNSLANGVPRMLLAFACIAGCTDEGGGIPNDQSEQSTVKPELLSSSSDSRRDVQSRSPSTSDGETSDSTRSAKNGDNVNGSGRDVVRLDQGWTHDESDEFYFTNQGSALLPYDWFLRLEKADSEELFRSDANMNSLGYIPQPTSARNPDGLPIGFVLCDDPAAREIRPASFSSVPDDRQYPATQRWLGLTCGACHTANLTYRGTTVRVDGAPGMIDHERFVARLAEAMRATCSSGEKLKRFCDAVNGSGNDEASSLKRELESWTAHLERLVERNRAEHAYGFARLDAFGAIFNEVSVVALGIPSNRHEANAPVSIPYIWHAPELDFVQWNRSASNSLARNLGQVFGVYAHLQLAADPEARQFQSTASFDGLNRLENLLRRLKAPAWPEAIFGEIDDAKVQAGAALYDANCRSCHPVREADGSFRMTEANELGNRFIRTVPLPARAIGTDRLMVDNIRTRTAKPGTLKSFLPAKYQSQSEVPAPILLSVAVRQVIARYVEENQLSSKRMSELNGGRLPRSLDDESSISDGYIARPLYGIWATAPFLHNGSVPNLYELLRPQEQRRKSFHVGSREFDPKQVGFVTSESAERSFLFEVVDAERRPIPGNSNQGHSGHRFTQTRGSDRQWRNFSDEERWALIEFMKTLR